MKVAIVPASRLAEAGRMDAPFHIAWEENRAAVQAVLDRLTQDDLARLIELLPFDPEAAKLVYQQLYPVTQARLHEWAKKPGVRKLYAAVYCARAAHSAGAKIRAEVDRLHAEQMAWLGRLDAVLGLAEGKNAQALVALVQKEEEGLDDRRRAEGGQPPAVPGGPPGQPGGGL